MSFLINGTQVRIDDTHSVNDKVSAADSHIGSTSNPHSTTAAQVGAEPANANIQTHIGSTSNPHLTTYSQVGAAASGHNHNGTYEPVITAGNTAQYWRGDKTWQTLPTPDLSTYAPLNSPALTGTPTINGSSIPTMTSITFYGAPYETILWGTGNQVMDSSGSGTTSAISGTYQFGGSISGYTTSSISVSGVSNTVYVQSDPSKLVYWHGKFYPLGGTFTYGAGTTLNQNSIYTSGTVSTATIKSGTFDFTPYTYLNVLISEHSGGGASALYVHNSGGTQLTSVSIPSTGTYSINVSNYNYSCYFMFYGSPSSSYSAASRITRFYFE